MGATHDDLLKPATTVFLALYGQPAETSIESARFTRNKKSPKVKESTNHLWKAADQQSPPDESMDNTDFSWKIQDDVPVPAVAERDSAPPQLSDVINCQCKAVGKNAAPKHAAVIENTSTAPVTATAVDTMAAAIPIQHKD